MTTQVNLTESQYQHLLAALDEERSKFMNLLYISAGGSILLLLPGIMSLSGRGGGLYVSAAGALWLICAIMTAVLLITGYQKKFGSNCPYSQLKNRNYTCELIQVTAKSGAEGRPPYLLTDVMGNQFVCPIYMEFKYIQPGGNAIGVFLQSGGRYAVHDPSNDTY
ncbi:MAG: hypothetical protein MJ065_03080 [Oscillospiraceae bacterium]|nr:hypothetical protein [Oscillospiraceae bacterium]